MTTSTERLSSWPFQLRELHQELAAAGLRVESNTYQEDVDRYRVTARRHERGRGSASSQLNFD